MPITEKKQPAPLWRCQDCSHTFSGGAASPDVAHIDDAHIDDAHDIFSPSTAARPPTSARAAVAR